VLLSFEVPAFFAVLPEEAFFTVTLQVSFFFPTLAVILAVPAFFAVIFAFFAPVFFTDATEDLEDFQRTFPFAFLTVSVVLFPTVRVTCFFVSFGAAAFAFTGSTRMQRKSIKAITSF
jgi:hypothetical protein